MRSICFLRLLWLIAGLCAGLPVWASPSAAVSTLEAEVPLMQFNMLDVYVVPGIDFPSTDPYAFKGKRLDPKLVTQAFGATRRSGDYLPDENAQSFAIGRFWLTPRIGVFLVRENNRTVTQLSINCWLYDAKEKKLLQSITIANSYGYEGSQGTTECWIKDLTNDGILDFLQRSYDESVVGDSIRTNNSFTLLRLQNDSLNATGLGFPALLAEQFTFHSEPFIPPAGSALLMDSLGLTINAEQKNWFIPLDSSRSLKEMNTALDTLQQHMRNKPYFFHTHGWIPVVYAANGNYYIGFQARCQPNIAELDLADIRAHFAANAKLLQLCNNPAFINGAFCCDCN